MIKVNGGKLNRSATAASASPEETMDLLKAVHNDTVDDFPVAHPDWIDTEKG
jgi:hypothetical protein